MRMEDARRLAFQSTGLTFSISGAVRKVGVLTDTSSIGDLK